MSNNRQPESRGRPSLTVTTGLAVAIRASRISFTTHLISCMIRHRGEANQPSPGSAASQSVVKSRAWHRDRRSTRIARRDEGEYWAYVTEEQR